MRRELVDLYVRVKSLHAEAHLMHSALMREVEVSGSTTELADIAYAADKIEAFLNDIRKAMTGMKDVAEKRCTTLWVAMGDPDSIRTDYVTATPYPKMMVRMPSRKKEPEEWANMMRDMRIPEEYIITEPSCHPPVEPNWPGMIDYVTDLLAQGKKLPRGLDPSKTYTLYQLRKMPRKEVDAEYRAESKPEELKQETLDDFEERVS